MLKFVLMKKLSFLVIFLFMITNNKYAQCAMCKSVVESNMEGGSKIGAGLNDAILFLMAMPYLSLAIIAFVWLRYKNVFKA